MGKLDYVNIKQGTDTSTEFSTGNTLPYTMLPFGMNAFAPMTDEISCYFQPRSRRLFGIRLTHQPSPWIGDYGQMLFMPQTGGFNSNPTARAASYRPREAVLRPDYIKVEFLRYGAQFELTPTERGAAIRLNFDGRGTPRLSVFSMDFPAEFHIDLEKRELTGFTRALRHGGNPEKFAEYFVMRFDCPLDEKETQIQYFDKTETGTDVEGKGVNISAAFTKNEVYATFATSYVSVEQARVNLEREIGEKSFDEVRAEAIRAWEDCLGKVELTGDEEMKKTFYTCLYRAHTFPHKFYEITADGRTVHYSPALCEVRDGVSYVDNGFWDTGRTCYSFYSLLCPEDLEEMVEGFVNIYRDSGWLPKWLGPGEIGAMPGTFIDCILADCAVKGILKGKTLEDALEAMIHHAEVKPGIPMYGRAGIEDFKEKGYVPYEGFGESVNHTLDYAFGDFCIGQVATVLGKDDVAKKYYQRAFYYRNLYNQEKGFMIGRDRDGNWREDFDEFAWGRDYCEAGAWQGTWAVFHDILGLADLMGGREIMARRVDQLHSMKPIFKTGGYWHEIHEMSEMAAVDFGQCAICNQPSFHIPYLSAAIGKPATTQQVIRRMTAELFSAKDDGFPGDEDNGSMSCWYLFSALGFYPFCVGTGEYVLGAPRFDRAEVKLGNGRTLTVVAENNAMENLYVSSITLDGAPVDAAYLTHERLLEGGTLTFTLAPAPREGGLLPEEKLPFSLSRSAKGEK